MQVLYLLATVLHAWHELYRGMHPQKVALGMTLSPLVEQITLLPQTSGHCRSLGQSP